MPGMLVSRRSSTLRAMPPGVSTVARPSDSCRLADGLLRGCANRMSTATIGAGIELDGGVMAPVMGDPGDPTIDDRYVAARQIGPDIGRNVVTIGEERQRVGPIVEQPDMIVRLRAGPDEAPMLAGDFKAVAIRAGDDGRSPAFGKARNIRHLVDDAIAQDHAARPKTFTIASEDGEIVYGAGDAVGPGINQPDRGIARQLLPRLCQYGQRCLVIVSEQTMRVAGDAGAR